MGNSFLEKLGNCECCPRRCGVNRLSGIIGYCGISSLAGISHFGLHFGEEPPISGTKGSGTIFFAGCNLGCVFCQNYQISQEFDIENTKVYSSSRLADEMIRLQNKGAHNINFVSPSHMIFQMAEAIVKAKGKGLTIPVVYNSNGYDSIDALREIRGLVDIYLPDIKYMDNEVGKRLSMVDDYADILPDVLREMFRQVGVLNVDHRGIAKKGLLVRHLVLPGYPKNSKKCIGAVADISTDIPLSIMSQYSPQYKAKEFPEIDRHLRETEYNEIVDFALNRGFDNLFVQEMESSSDYLPDFSKDNPFG